MANPGKIVLVFEVYEGGEFQRREELSAESVTIGSGVAAMLRIENAALADLQAVINVGDDGDVRILDVVGKQDGTKVNGAGVNNCALRTGDELGFGSVTVKVSVIDAGAFSDDEATQLGMAPEMPAAGLSGLSLDKPAAAAAPASADDAGELEEQEAQEDVVAFMMRSGTSSNDAGIDKKAPKVLEVAEAWSNTLMEVKHFAKGQKSITVGSTTGTRWRYLGLPVAWVPPAFGYAAWLFGPTLSDVTQEWKNDFYGPPENMPDADFKLFEWQGGSYVANISDKWTGFVDIGEERHSFQELIASGKARSASGGVYQVEISEETRLFADTGHVYFFGQMVHPSKKIISKLTDGIDYPFLGSMTFMSFVFFLLSYVYVVSPTPPDPEMVEIPDRFVELVLEQPPPEEPKKEQSKPDANPDAGEGAKAKGDEGKVGKKDAKMKEAKGNKVEANKQQLDKEVAENAGVLGALRDAGSSMDGFGSSALNSDLTGGIGGLVGAKGTQMGSGGLGSRGGGLGGGGTAEGLGGLGTKGRGSGASGYGTGGGNFGSRGEGGIGKIGGDPIILGALDKSLIDAVIKRNMNQIRYCYQRELTKDPSLGGKITVKFVIAKDGSVSKAEIKQGMGSKAVEGCIAGRFLRFKFPEPKGGGIVIVSYPFIFSPG
jgi:outer membrane biosynthesis protein TonB